MGTPQRFCNAPALPQRRAGPGGSVAARHKVKPLRQAITALGWRRRWLECYSCIEKSEQGAGRSDYCLAPGVAIVLPRLYCP